MQRLCYAHYYKPKGDPLVIPGRNTCGGARSGSCSFTITQNICVEVPVEFGADADVGDPFVSCGRVSSENICAGCGEDTDN